MRIQGLWIDENLVDELFGKFGLTKNKFAFNSNWNYLAEQKLFYSLKEMKIEKFELTLKIQRRKGAFGLPVRSKYFNQREIPSLHFLIAEPEQKKLISHKRVQLRSDLQTITIPYEKGISNSSFLYIFSDAYTGVDLMYRIQDFKNSSQKYIKNPKKQKTCQNSSCFFISIQFQMKNQIVNCKIGKKIILNSYIKLLPIHLLTKIKLFHLSPIHNFQIN
jgi:hypothetical protein